MRIAKVFNNSVVLGVDDRGTEFVLLGRGIGFQAKPGQRVEASLVEKRFVPGGETSVERLAMFLDEIPLADIEVTEEIVRAAREELGDRLSEHVLFPLADHISFALRRAREGTAIEYPLRWEVESLYPGEVTFARRALAIVAERRGVTLPDLEAVPLALHLVNAQFGSGDISETVRLTTVMTEVLDLVAGELRLDLEEMTVPVSRFVTHLRYLFLRRDDPPRGPSLDDSLGPALRTARPREFAVGERVAALLSARLERSVGADETLYLALHLSRLTEGLAREAEDDEHGRASLP